MRLALLPLCLVALPAFAQWDLRLELPRPTGQNLPLALILGTGQLVSGNFDTGSGYIATANRRLFQIGPLLKLEGGFEYSLLSANGRLALDTATQGTKLQQRGLGVGVNAQIWVPFVGLAGEIGLIQRFQRYTYNTAGAATTRDLNRTWLRVGTRWRIPSVLVHPYVAASYQQPVTKEHPVQLGGSYDLANYFAAQGSGQEFERMWTFGVGVSF
jgi:hypothetical protein